MLKNEQMSLLCFSDRKSLDRLKAIKVTFQEVILCGQSIKGWGLLVFLSPWKSEELAFTGLWDSTGMSSEGTVLEACRVR